MGLDNPLHIAFLVVILLLVFGAKRLPEIGRSLGSGMREFKQSVTGESGAQPPALTAAAQPEATQPPAAPAGPPAVAPPVGAAHSAPTQPAPVEPPQRS
jgi:sec-independent protein translocase protein TatA